MGIGTSRGKTAIRKRGSRRKEGVARGEKSDSNEGRVSFLLDGRLFLR